VGTHIILWAWWTSVVMDALLTVHLLRSGLFRRYRWLTAMAAFQASLSAVLMYTSWPLPKPHPYADIWKAAQLPAAVLQLAAALEGVLVLTYHLQHRRFARGLLGFLAGLSLLASFAVCRIENRGVDDLRFYVTMSEYTGALLLLLSLFSLGFIRHTRVMVRRNAVRNVLILALFFASLFAGTFVRSASEGHAAFAWSLITVCGQLLCYTAWLTLTPAGERLPKDPEPAISAEEFHRLFSEDRKATAELSEISSEALRKAVRPTGI
jgi:hypothetical protein